MEKIMVIVFDDEKKAYEGIKSLEELDRDGRVAIHQGVLLRKKADGKVETDVSAFAELPVQTLVGTSLGALVGALAGPVGVAVGAGAGALTGMFGDLFTASLDEDFLKEVSGSLKPGGAAVAIDLTEEWVTPIDTELERYSTSIVRRPKVDVEDELLARRAEASEKELAALKDEMSRASEQRKAKLRERIEQVKTRVRAQADRLDAKRKQIHGENVAKSEALKRKISDAATEAKANIEARLTALRERDLAFTRRVDEGVGERLRKLADSIERKSG